MTTNKTPKATETITAYQSALAAAIDRNGDIVCDDGIKRPTVRIDAAGLHVCVYPYGREVVRFDAPVTEEFAAEALPHLLALASEDDAAARDAWAPLTAIALAHVGFAARKG